MKIDNRTRFSTADLRRIAVRVAKGELDAEQRKRLKIRVVPGRGWWTSRNGCSGVCWGRSLIEIRVPTLTPDPNAWHIKLEVAAVLAHEMHHAAGGANVHGRAAERWMRRSSLYGRPKDEAGLEKQRQAYAWLNDVTLSFRTPPAKVALTPEQRAASRAESAAKLKEKRAAKAAAALLRWERRLKLAQAKVRTYRRRVRYYDRATTQAAMPGKEGQS